jgi:hypothetical protein
MFRSSHVVVGVLALTATACNDTTSNFVVNSAAVRLVNDTDTPLTVSSRGRTDTLNRRLVFGQSSTCLLVDLSNTTVPPLTVMNAVTGVSITFTPPLAVGDNVIIFAFGDSLGQVQLNAISNRFVPAANDAGLRFFNGVPQAGSLRMARNTVVLTPFVGVGSASPFVSVPIDSGRITFANSVNVVLDAGLMAFPQGQNSTVVVGPPASDTTVLLRFFTAQGC